MANSPDFVAHALDLLSSIGPVTARAMFGGHGVYLRGVMFALLDDDELFLKADDLSRPRYLEAGCRQWTYPGPKGTVPGGYFRPPDEAHEEPEARAKGRAKPARKAAPKAVAKVRRERRGTRRPAP
jgi:DNA transformation protein